MAITNLKTALKEGFKCNDNGYFDSFLDNVYGKRMEQKFQDMFDKGSGNELHSKAEAIHSSSMLAYNFFHWIDGTSCFNYDGINYTNVFFEVRMKTLKNSNFPANMDVVLTDKEHKHLLFIESKFTEYCETKKWDLSDSYKKENAFNNNIEWDEIIKEIREEVINCKTCKYKDGIKQFITHLFGIANLCNDKAIKWFNDHNEFSLSKLQNYSSVKFINLIFEPKEHDFKEEYESYKCYQSLFKKVQDMIKGKIIIGQNPLEIIWMSYSKLWNNKNIEGLNKIDEGELSKYLWQRYMQFAEGAER